MTLFVYGNVHVFSTTFKLLEIFWDTTLFFAIFANLTKDFS